MTERQERILENERKEAKEEVIKTLINNGIDASSISKALNLSDTDLQRITRKLY